MTEVAQAVPERQFFGQPRLLANLFGVEMWERFSYYAMGGILLLYLYYPVAQGGLALPQGTAVSIAGAYGGLVYLRTIAGAWVADRLPAHGAARDDHPRLRASAGDHRRHVRLHDRRAPALTGRAVAVDQAGAGRVPDPDGRAVLPLRGAGHGPVRPARPVLLGGRPGALLRHPRRGRHRHRRRPRPDVTVAEAPHGRRALTPRRRCDTPTG